MRPLLLLVVLVLTSCTTTSRVVRIEHDALTFENGTRVAFDYLPISNDAFRRAVRNAQLGDNGDVFVLVDVPATCGNDPVQELVVRLSVQELIGFAEDGVIDRDDLYRHL